MTSNITRVPRMLSMRQVAAQYGICTKTVARWIKHHGLRAHHIGRTVKIDEADAIAFMASRRS
jgi:excisionase family DNA binding protein